MQKQNYKLINYCLELAGSLNENKKLRIKIIQEYQFIYQNKNMKIILV